jgi:DNA replication and repair protein RecF
MSLLRIEASDLRNIESASLVPSRRRNFIVGPNASGKTSLLEAIYLLGRARSFKTRESAQLIRFGRAALTVAGKATDAEDTEFAIGIRVSRGQRELHLAGKPVQSSAELTRAFPVLAIQPAAVALVEAPPKLRRQFLDFGAFHNDSAFLENWRRYAKALSQRNSLLRAQRPRGLTPWSQELVRYGTIVAEARRNYVERLQPYFRELGTRFFPERHLDLRLHPGWNAASDLAAVLEKEVAADLRYGHTQSGPHKGDFTIFLDGRPARTYLSRGQLKLLVYVLLLAQSCLMGRRGTAGGCVLIDDVASELDEANKRTLLGVLRERSAQFFITATAREFIEEGLDEDAALFRMERGKLFPA